jgi:hypothetical protein
MISDIKPVELRFYSKIQFDENTWCWNWTACKSSLGYGQFVVKNKKLMAYRFSYELLKGHIPSGLELDHLCRNPKCVNPDHLEAVTHQENIKRGNSGKLQKSKTHCIRGHEFNQENIYPYRNNRHCKECGRIRHRKYNKTHKEQKNEYNRQYRLKHLKKK